MNLDQNAKEILLADASVEQLNVLLTGLRSDVDVQLITPHDDAVGLMAQALATQHLDTLHVLGHGAPGEVILGGQKIDATAMPQLAQQLSQSQPSHNPDLQICLWSCQTGADQAGEIFMNSLANTDRKSVV